MKQITIKHIVKKAMFMVLPFIGGVVGGLFTSCSDYKIDYTPAEPIAASNWGVYFDGKNVSEFPRSATDPNTLEFTLKRTNTNGAVTVPLEATVSSGKFEIPQSVTFNDGEESATISVTYSGLENGKLTAFISVPEMYINPYTEKEGFYKQSIIVYEPTLVGTVRVRQNTSSSLALAGGIFEGLESTITQVPGENRFFWNNFLGSGITLSFKIDEDNGTFAPDDVMKCNGAFAPLNHYANDSEGGGWYFCTEEDAANLSDYTCHTWSTDKGSVESYLYFYYGSSYAKIDFGYYGTYGYGRFYAMVQDDNYDDYWFYIYPVGYGE